MPKEPDDPYLINVIFNHNNYGLTNDAKILVNVLRKSIIHGFICKVRPVQAFQTDTAPVDINIFLEIVNPLLLHSAKVNILIPNHEWFYNHWEPYLDLFDFIWCKTEYACQLFRELLEPHNKTTTIHQIGWTSLDRGSLTSTNKVVSPRKALHLAGGSQYKSTQQVINSWNPDWIPLTVVLNTERLPKITLQSQPNITYLTKRLTDTQLIQTMNSHSIHICPSETEGFGHYLNEARSSSAIIVTVDAPPMNTFSTPAFSIGTTSEKLPHTLGNRVRWKSSELSKIITNQINSLSDEKLAKLGKTNRHNFLADAKKFQKNCYSALKLAVNRVTVGFKPKISKEIKLSIPDLPYVTIVTLTHNRREFFPLALSNYLGTDYPQDRLEWRIIDDSDPDHKVQDLIPKDSNIHYHYVDPSHTIASKRNLGVQLAKGELIAMMDDDDIYLPRHLLLRVANLQFYQKQCCYCSSIACFHINKIISTINVPPLPWPPETRVAEASLLFTKSFWEKRTFNAEDVGREGISFLKGRYQSCVEVSWKEIMVSLLHSKNTSNRVTVGDTPNGCHFGFSDQLFQLITNLDNNPMIDSPVPIKTEQQTISSVNSEV